MDSEDLWIPRSERFMDFPMKIYGFPNPECEKINADS